MIDVHFIHFRRRYKRAIMIQEELIFQKVKPSLQLCCCSSKNPTKLQLFSISEDGFRIYCQHCLKMADGKTIHDAIENFTKKEFKF